MQNQHKRELTGTRNTDITQVQQQRPELPTVTLTWHACKYKVHKLHQRCTLKEKQAAGVFSRESSSWPSNQTKMGGLSVEELAFSFHCCQRETENRIGCLGREAQVQWRGGQPEGQNCGFARAVPACVNIPQ